MAAEGGRKLRNFELDRYWLRIVGSSAKESWEELLGKGWRSVLIPACVTTLAAIMQFSIVGWNATLDNLKIIGSSIAAGIFVFVVLLILAVIKKPCELKIKADEHIAALTTENLRLKQPDSDAPNLQVDFDSAPLGPIYLTPEGVWSASYSASAIKWSGLRLKVSNLEIRGKKVGLAKDVSVRVKFEHDTGLDAASAAPTAWLHEKLGYVDIRLGEEKQAIIAVRNNHDWYTVTNVRDASGYPQNAAAMHFQDAPWFKGKLHIGLIASGETIEQSYFWEVSDESIFPRIRKIPSVEESASQASSC